MHSHRINRLSTAQEARYTLTRHRQRRRQGPADTRLQCISVVHQQLGQTAVLYLPQGGWVTTGQSVRNL